MRIVYLWRLCFTVGANRLALRVPSRDGIRSGRIGASQWIAGGLAVCPVCGVRSRSRHSSYLRIFPFNPKGTLVRSPRRSLQNLPAQGTRVTIRARLTRWRCQNGHCEQRIFAERLPEGQRQGDVHDRRGCAALQQPAQGPGARATLIVLAVSLDQLINFTACATPNAAYGD